MKKFLSLILLGFLSINLAISASSDTLYVAENINDSVRNFQEDYILDLEKISFKFERELDTATLNPFDYGTVTFNWTSLKSNDKDIYIKYKPTKNGDWVTASNAINSNELVLTDISENHVYEYYLGTSTGKKAVRYETKLRHFNSICESIFENNSGKGKEEAAEVSWALPHNLVEEILTLYPNASYTLKYNTKIGEKQNKADKSKAPWIVEEGISLNEVHKKIKGLAGGESYVYRVGIVLDDQTIWSEKNKFTTERSWGIFRLLVLIGSLGMFIFGMKIMSEGLQKAAGSRLRNMLGSITSNRVSGVLTGFGITTIVQSSSVTTVMTVSFVNAGLLTLRQSAGVMMGANIGTTITAWLILVFGFKVDLSSFALIFIAFGAPLLFFSKGKAKSWASVIIGFALLFMGLGELKDAVPSLGPDSPIVQFFIDFKDVWYGPLMFVFLGAIVTVVIQSSSAAMALTMTLVAGGVIPFEVASAMILGENIGTTITAELASLIGNVHAKRSARIHSLFNIIGVGWAILLFPFILQLIASMIEGNPYEDGAAANTALATFHTLFNAINVLLLLPFVPWLVRVAERTVKSKGGADEEFHLDYIGSGLMNTPDIAILEAKKEVAKFGEITSRMSGFTQSLLTEQNKKLKSKLHDKIAKYEEITDRVEIEVVTYLSKVSEGEMSEDTALKIRSMNSIVNDLERIGDIFYQMSKALERKDELKAWFVPKQRESLFEMFKLVDKAFVIMVDNLNADWDSVLIEPAKAAESKINRKRDEMRAKHLENIGNSDFNMESGMVYSNLFSSCEKVGDHIINVSEAITGEI